MVHPGVGGLCVVGVVCGVCCLCGLQVRTRT